MKSLFLLSFFPGNRPHPPSPPLACRRRSPIRTGRILRQRRGGRRAGQSAGRTLGPVWGNKNNWVPSYYSNIFREKPFQFFKYAKAYTGNIFLPYSRSSARKNFNFSSFWWNTQPPNSPHLTHYFFTSFSAPHSFFTTRHCGLSLGCCLRHWRKKLRADHT